MRLTDLLPAVVVGALMWATVWAAISAIDAAHCVDHGYEAARTGVLLDGYCVRGSEHVPAWRVGL